MLTYRSEHGNFSLKIYCVACPFNIQTYASARSHITACNWYDHSLLLAGNSSPLSKLCVDHLQNLYLFHLQELGGEITSVNDRIEAVSQMYSELSELLECSSISANITTLQDSLFSYITCSSHDLCNYWTSA